MSCVAKGHCNTENIGCRDWHCKGFGDRADRVGFIGHGATWCCVLISMSYNLASLLTAEVARMHHPLFDGSTSYPSSQDCDNIEAL